jgi:uncharacterized membrane protein
MFRPGCLTLLAILALLILLPFFFAQLMLTALSKLGLSPLAALLALFSIVVGGNVNIPVKQIPREYEVYVDSFALFGFRSIFPRRRVMRRYMTLAVNVGGCVIPCAIALYEILRVADRGADALVALTVASLANIAVCYRIARPWPNVGIAMPAFIPPLIAASLSLLLLPDFAPPVAFVAGVVGPLVGGDLLHLKDLQGITTGMASIGGAGTFDGIILSGLVAALLA